MNRFNRDYAVVSAKGRILLESNSPDRCETLRRELAEEGVICSVIKSDLPSLEPFPGNGVYLA